MNEPNKTTLPHLGTLLLQAANRRALLAVDGKPLGVEWDWSTQRYGLQIDGRTTYYSPDEALAFLRAREVSIR